MGSLSDRSFPHQDDRDNIKEMKCMTLGSCGLAEGTNAHTLQIATAVVYCINGLVYSKAITDNIAMTACSQQAVSTYAKYLVSINASGTVHVAKGTSASTAAAALLPDLPADSAPLGYFQVATDGTHTFTSGTTDLSATGITATYQDLVVMPNDL